jgi:hypothetical protein
MFEQEGEVTRAAIDTDWSKGKLGANAADALFREIARSAAGKTD